MAYIYQAARAELRDQIARHRGAIQGRVLDVGSSAFPRYRDLFVFDSYTTMDLESGPGIDVAGKAEALPFPDGSFDSILCTQVIGDVYDLRQAFAEFYRVLAPDGTALITEGFMDPLHAEPYDFWRFTEHSMRRLAEDAGFTIEALERRGGYYSVMVQFRTRYWIDRLQPYDRWYRGLFSAMVRFLGERARRRDARDRSIAGRRFTHGYLLVIRKYAYVHD